MVAAISGDGGKAVASGGIKFRIFLTIADFVLAGILAAWSFALTCFGSDPADAYVASGMAWVALYLILVAWSRW